MDPLDEMLFWVAVLQDVDLQVTVGKATASIAYPGDIVGFFRMRDGKDIYASIPD